MIEAVCKIIKRTASVAAAFIAVIWMSAVFAGHVFADSPEQQADRMIADMSTKEKIAQMMVVSLPAYDAASIQEKYQFGGYILFGRDFYRTGRKGMRELIASVQENSDIPVLVGTDEEGGTVVRASLYPSYRKTRFRSPRQVYKEGGYSGIIKETKSKDKFLKSLGLNCNFGPVADVPYSRYDFMYDRAFSTSAGKTKNFVKLTVSQMGKDKVVSVLKHFPGYGGNGDTHNRIIQDKRSLRTFKRRDLKPFSAGIKAGADMIMVSHIKVNAFDSKKPASLSGKVHKYLRNEMGFEGVIITDGLDMSGIMDSVGGDKGKAAVMAVRAGNDMICVTGDYKVCYQALRNAVKKGDISGEQLDKSVKRILLMKIKRGIVPRSRLHRTDKEVHLTE
ncbi:MAG: beta-hexosaminidase [Mogibacterium sp.]|nr:beta-hexosaminidase [Mogibacterium sp.]